MIPYWCKQTPPTCHERLVLRARGPLLLLRVRSGVFPHVFPPFSLFRTKQK